MGDPSLFGTIGQAAHLKGAPAQEHPEHPDRMESVASSPFIRIVPQRSKQDHVTTWREVGWVFRDGETLTIERCGPGSRVREGQI